MRVLVSGSTGLIGSGVVDALEARGHTPVRLVRESKDKPEQELRWDINQGTIENDKLEGLDAVIHLAGESLFAPRWTKAKKEAIRNSRVEGTKLLVNALASLENPPRHLLSTSAIGYYGSRGDEICTEDVPPGAGFLAEVCVQWENAAKPAAGHGIRVVLMRFGVVLTKKGGALSVATKPFKMGVGGVLGSGKQYMSWIAFDDLVSAIMYMLEHDNLSGPVNVTAPNPITNREFTKTMGAVLNRPTAVPTPAFALRLAAGELADEMLLASVRAVPAKLQGTDFVFQYPHFEAALRHELDQG
jgi:uncharacterized protein